jgi:hypothetical protein
MERSFKYMPLNLLRNKYFGSFDFLNEADKSCSAAYSGSSRSEAWSIFSFFGEFIHELRGSFCCFEKFRILENFCFVVKLRLIFVFFVTYFEFSKTVNVTRVFAQKIYIMDEDLQLYDCPIF